jgi:cellulose synthase/poly-beta-1,6-N-acetylglucosamine synthase-like glycosyltransferase
MSYIEILLAAIAVLLLIPTLVIFAQVLFACLPKVHNNVVPDDDMNIAVLIPAHNESSGIVVTLNSIRPQLKSADRLLVVADNCSDDTAVIAAVNGAEVVERHDANNRGKGYALDFGVRHLSLNPPDVVVVIDADCTLEADSLNRLAACALYRGRPVQSLYLMKSPVGAGPETRVAEFAWLVKNLVRPLGNLRLGLPCELMGTGMAFPWGIISNAGLANSNIVEDMKLGIDLTKLGKPPLFFPDALVTSYFPTTSEAQSGQRTRWEHGHLGMILSETPDMFKQAIAGRNIDLLAMTFDLCVPPLALLVVLLIGFIVLTGIASLAGLSVLPFQVTLLSIILLGGSILLAWLGWGRQIISITAFLVLPIYVFSKVPHYLKFLSNRQKNWVRTDRK